MAKDFFVWVRALFKLTINVLRFDWLENMLSSCCMDFELLYSDNSLHGIGEEERSFSFAENSFEDPDSTGIKNYVEI